MRLHWSPKSPYVRKVMVCAHELQLTRKIQLVRSVASMLKPNATLMQDNPLSKIPTLILENGLALFDSTVICEYLNDLTEGPLFPPHGEKKWQALRWQAFGDGLLDALILWRNERERERPLPMLIDAFRLKVDKSLTALDGEAQTLSDARFGIGHVAIACALGYIDYRFDTLSWRKLAPQLASWADEAFRRDSLQQTQPMDG